jgi:hypothetical protein
VSYLIAAALAVAALVFVLGAAVDALILAGLPPYAAHLILAVVAGGIAYVFFLHGKNKKLTKARKEEAAETAYAPGLHVRIVRTSPPRRKTRAGRRTASRKTPRKRESTRVVIHRN